MLRETKPFKNVSFFYQPSESVIYTDKIPVVYRVQSTAQLFNFATLLLGIYSPKQSKPTVKDIVNHQKSATYVGTTDDKEIAIKIAKVRQDNNIILTIDPNFLELINVNETIRYTDYFPPFEEREHATLLLPICAIKEFEFNQNERLDNPLYILPTKENIEEYKNLYKIHRDFLMTIFKHGERMKDEERGQMLTDLVISYARFYHGKTNINPFRTKIGVLTNPNSHPLFRFFLSGLRPDKTIEELITHYGDKIIYQDSCYRNLQSSQEFYRLLAIDNPYGTRSSYAKL